MENEIEKTEIIEKAGGLLPHTEDERDYEYHQLGGIFGGYTPKNEVLELPEYSTKNQGRFNDCTFNALAVQREITEKVPLSVKSVVCYARKQGYLTGDGYSDLRSGQKTALEFGLAEESLLPDVKSDWDSYSAETQLTDAIRANANTHRTKAFFKVTTKDEFLKALDDGYAIHCGMDWFTGYNMGGGLTAPWILPWAKGIGVGGHAICCVGYDLKKQLLKFKNSYGPDWGDRGHFYVRFQDWFGSNWPGYVGVDMDEDTFAQFLKSYEGKHVKSASSPVIYLIENGKKRAFPNEATFYAFGGVLGEKQTWQLVSQSLLDQTPNGEVMDIAQSPYWPALKSSWHVIQWLQFPGNFKLISDKIKAFGNGSGEEQS